MKKIVCASSIRRLFCVPFLALAVLAGPVLAQGVPVPPGFKQLVAAAKSQIKTIDMETFKAKLDKNEVGLLIDVREPGEYAEGHVAGAINVPRGLIELKIWPLVGFPDKTDMNKQLTLYCGTGARCVLATKSLQDLGFTNATAVTMTLIDWEVAGHKLVQN